MNNVKNESSKEIFVRELASGKTETGKVKGGLFYLVDYKDIFAVLWLGVLAIFWMVVVATVALNIWGDFSPESEINEATGTEISVPVDKTEIEVVETEKGTCFIVRGNEWQMNCVLK